MLIIRQQYFDKNQYWLTNQKVEGFFFLFVALHYTFFTVKLKFKSAANTEVSGFSTTLLISNL